MAGAPRHNGPSAGRTSDLPAQVSAAGDGEAAGLEPVALSLDALARDIRKVFGLGAEISDARLLESLVRITEKGERRARWLAAFNSPLGSALSARGCDLSTALGDILSVLPAARS